MSTPPTMFEGDTTKLAPAMADVTKQVGMVAKRGHNDFHGYDYATEADVSQAVSDALAEHGIMHSFQVTHVEHKYLTSDKDKSQVFTTVQTYHAFSDGKGHAYCSSAGGAMDAGDKGTSKAITASVKYALLKTFLIATGDDIEASSPEASGAQPGTVGSGSTNNPAQTGSGPFKKGWPFGDEKGRALHEVEDRSLHWAITEKWHEASWADEKYGKWNRERYDAVIVEQQRRAAEDPAAHDEQDIPFGEPA